ncbi:MAG: RhuM family protein, partial [Candidatus Omnitrophota bacterium]
MKKLPDNQIVFYQSLEGSVHIEVLYAEENIWLTQKKMAELFGTTPQNITMHLKNIYASGEIEQSATCKDFLQVQQEGKREIKRNASFYSLEVIIAIGYRVNSERGIQFRQWATEI